MLGTSIALHNPNPEIIHQILGYVSPIGSILLYKFSKSIEGEFHLPDEENFSRGSQYILNRNNDFRTVMSTIALLASALSTGYALQHYGPIILSYINN